METMNSFCLKQTKMRSFQLAMAEAPTSHAQHTQAGTLFKS